MPRIPRNYIKTSYFHVITQGINKSYIFNYKEDILYYIKLIYKLSKEENIEIVAYCIMNNHAHILLSTENIVNLSKYMQRLNTRYGMYYNNKYERVGYVFRDRYKSEGIYSDEQLYNCINYIYNNPVKAGICENPEEYMYSNYKKINYDIKSEYTFLDIDNENAYEEIIKNYLKDNEITLNELTDCKRLLKELVILLKMEYRVSLRKVARLLHINREKIRRLYNN